MMNFVDLKNVKVFVRYVNSKLITEGNLVPCKSFDRES